jgi:hypothetical protein
VPDRVRLIGIGCLQKLLEVIAGQSCLALDLALDGGNELLIGVANVLVIVTLIAAGGDHESLGSPLRPPLVAYGTPFCALVGCLGWCPPIAAGGCLPAALDENGPDRLLTKGMPGGDVEKLLRCLWLVMAKLMHQGLVICVRPECRNDASVVDHREFMTLLGETPNVVPQGFALLLSATLQISRIAGLHVCALKIAGKDIIEIFPTIDRVLRQVVKPGTRCVGQENGEELDNKKVIVSPARSTCKSVVL